MATDPTRKKYFSPDPTQFNTTMNGPKLITGTFLIASFIFGCGTPPQSDDTSAKAADSVSTDEARAIAHEAFIWGFPMVDNYKTLYAQAVDSSGPDYKAPFNTLLSVARAFTPDDKAIITPNSDTPYSFLWADLRAEPLVLTVPEVEKGRYYALQFIDLYTQNFAYVGTRTTGNGAGKYMLVGPDWKGETPPGIAATFRSETSIAYVLYRTQLFGPDDIDNVKAVQAGYKVEGLNTFQGKPAPAAAPAVNWPAPTPDVLKDVSFFSYLNFLMQFAPVEPSEVALRAKFERIGITPGETFDVATLTPEMKTALQGGIDDGWKQFATFKTDSLDNGLLTSGNLFGDRAFLKNNYLYRFAGAKLGIYGNTREEAIYPAYFVDAKGQKLDASNQDYVMHFTKENMPPATAFWSVTMYDGKDQLLVANPLNRYLVNSTMLSQFKKDKDGGFTIYVQKSSPGAAKESNWLPAPDGPFYAILRLYQPKPIAYEGSWKQPAMEPVK